jgi:hypothetical protein
MHRFLSRSRASYRSTEIIAFTGNNISAKSDQASRSLEARLSTDRPDPENRDFKHEDPIEWTQDHRGQILRALYTIMLGNPQLRDRGRVPIIAQGYSLHHVVTKLRIQKLTSLSETVALVI